MCHKSYTKDIYKKGFVRLALNKPLMHFHDQAKRIKGTVYLTGYVEKFSPGKKSSGIILLSGCVNTLRKIVQSHVSG